VIGDPWQRRLVEAGFRPSRRLGQNFLVDTNLCQAIARSLPLGRDALVLEVGAGTGTLTNELLHLAGRVVAVEIDRRLVDLLRQRAAADWATEASRLDLLATDVLEAGQLAPVCLDALRAAGAERTGWVCVSNLPYSVAGPFLAALAQSPLPPQDGVVLTQLEMARRVLAAPGSRDYGTLSVLLQMAFTPALLRKVPPEVFRPRPKVDSALVRLGAARSWLGRPAEQRRRFARFLQALFGGRRKTLRNALLRVRRDGTLPGPDPDLVPADWLSRRPEELTPEQLESVHAMGERAAMT
jgi:16S rRNA (adenine1518-N6/adenine1519-N6)-dimethyltransferase